MNGVALVAGKHGALLGRRLAFGRHEIKIFQPLISGHFSSFSSQMETPKVAPSFDGRFLVGNC